MYICVLSQRDCIEDGTYICALSQETVLRMACISVYCPIKESVLRMACNLCIITWEY